MLFSSVSVKMDRKLMKIGNRSQYTFRKINLKGSHLLETYGKELLRKQCLGCVICTDLPMIFTFQGSFNSY